MGAVRRVAMGLQPRLFSSMVLIALVVGSAGGLATGLVSGGHRARTAVDRLLEQTRLPDVMLIDPTLTDDQVDEIRQLPRVEGATLLVGISMFVPDGEFVNMTASVDGRYGYDIDVPRIVRGRGVDPDATDEFVLGEKIAAAMGVDVGDVVHFETFSPDQVASFLAQGQTSEGELEDMPFLGPPVDLRLVGITRHPADLTTDDPMSYFVVLPNSFYEEYRGRIGEYFRFAMVDVGLSPSAAQEGAVGAAALRIAGDDASLDESGEQSGGPLASTLDFVGLSMMLLAAAIALAGIVVGGLLVARTVLRVGADTAPLVGIGMTTRERAASIAGALSPAAWMSGVVTLIVACASSALLPLGLARRAEPNPGFRLDTGALLIGTLATIGVVLATTALLALREVRRSDRGCVRRNAAVARLARGGMPVGPLIGVDLAVGSGTAGAPAGNHVACAAVAFAAATGIGALVLGASVDNLEETPAAYGWTWDFVITERAAEALADEPAVESLAVVRTGAITLGGRPMIVRGLTTIKGAPPILVAEGRFPGPGEVVLGRRTMADLGVAIGDSVTAQGTAGSSELRVVGEAVLAGVIDVPEAAWGAAVQQSDLDALGISDDTGAGAVVDLADGIDRDAFVEQLERRVGESAQPVEQPVELARLREIEPFPWILASFLAGVALIAVINAVVSTAGRRRRDLAVLRSLGLSPAGVIRAITVQSTVLVLIGLAIGVPLGLVIGQALWRALATSLGVVVIVAVPWPAILVATLMGIAVAAAIAVAPARMAARSAIAAALRAE